MQRRRWLQQGAALHLAAALWPHAARAGVEESVQGRRLLVVMLRGAMDGLCAVPAVGDPQLTVLRERLVAKPLLPLSSDFSLHPRLSDWHQAWQAGQAAIVHASSFAYRGRSHFEGQDIMQTGRPVPYTSGTGWLGRALQASGLGGGVALSIPMPLLLRGHEQSDTRMATWLPTPPSALMQRVGRQWAEDPVLATYARALVGPSEAMPPGGAMNEPLGLRRSPWGLAREAGRAMQAAHGPRVGLMDLHGFDTHASQGAAEGSHADRLGALNEVLRGFREGIGERWQDALVVTLTEFGRTAHENGTTGTDHGWGSAILMAGGLVARPQVVADWPGLARSQLFEGRDLHVTTDAATVYAQVLHSVLGLPPERVAREVMAFNPGHWREGLLRSV